MRACSGWCWRRLRLDGWRQFWREGFDHRGRRGFDCWYVGHDRLTESEVAVEASQCHGVWQTVAWGIWVLAVAFVCDLDQEVRVHKVHWWGAVGNATSGSSVGGHVIGLSSGQVVENGVQGEADVVEELGVYGEWRGAEAGEVVGVYVVDGFANVGRGNRSAAYVVEPVV